MTESARALSQQQKHKRAAILDGARSVFLRRGFSAASMDEVATEAGVGKQTVYRHFGSKEALVTGLVEAMCASWDDMVAGLVTAGDQSLAGRLRTFGAQLVDALISPDALALYRAIVGEAGRHPRLGQIFYDAGPRRAREMVAELLRERFDRKEAEQRAGAFIQLALGDTYLEMTLGISEPNRASRMASQLALAVAVAVDEKGARGGKTS
jgi:TetR/AcrR family transcriptional regulator, mexJK operon transcriptional repressor